MTSPRFTDTNSADDTAGRAFGLEGNLYLPVVVGVLVAIGIFATLVFVGVKLAFSAITAGAPLVAVGVWTAFFRHGKPAGYDRDRLDQFLGGSHFDRSRFSNTHILSHTRVPDGRFVGGMLLFGSPERGGLFAKGFKLYPPDLRGASIEQLNEFQDKIRSLLALVSPGRRLQVQWWPDSDYRSPLLRYHARTQEVREPVVRAIRNERFTRYWSRAVEGALRRENLALFLSIEITPTVAKWQGKEGIAAGYGTIVREISNQFDEFAETIRSVFGPATPVQPMGDVDHFTCIRRFLTPSLVRRTEDNPAQLFDPELSIQEACLPSDGVGQSHSGFIVDGHHHAVLTLSRWPQRTRPGIVAHLTGLPFLEYNITVNVRPLAGRQEVQREEKAAERLRGEYTAKPRTSVLVALRKKERKVEALSGGFTRPFHVTYVIRVWAATIEALRDKIAAVQAAINAMDGAQAYESALPTTANKLFFGTWPGWTHSSYHYRELYAEDRYLADILPFSATFTGELESADAIYDGSHGNLVGLRTAIGGSPQHAVLFGMTGAGKSAFVQDLLFQTASEFAHSLLIEEGLSYQRFTDSFGEKPIVLHPDAPFTLNYFDTQGLPLSQLHLASAVALLARMIAVSEKGEDFAIRQAQLSQYVTQLYRDTFLEWSRRNPQQTEAIKRLACAIHHWRTLVPGGATPVEAFVDLREKLANRDDRALTFVAQVSEEAIARFGQDPATERFVYQTACSAYSREDFPTHSSLVELLSYARFPEHGKDEIDLIATLLRAWTADGQYGRLFDGISNVSFQRRIVHFELGLIPDQAVDLKAAAGLLISGLGRQHILSLPREQRKLVLFEEVSRFLDIPGGEQIIAESYAQLRKHNCWAVSVVQQYAQFKDSRIRSTVIGNAKQFFFMRQNDRTEMIDLTRDLPVPETAIDAIQRYPLPEQLPPGRRFSSLCYFNPTTQPPQCGTVRHVQEDSCARAA